MLRVDSNESLKRLKVTRRPRGKTRHRERKIHFFFRAFGDAQRQDFFVVRIDETVKAAEHRGGIYKSEKAVSAEQLKLT